MNQNNLFQNSSPQKAAEFSGAAEEFCCLSLHRKPIHRQIIVKRTRQIKCKGDEALREWPNSVCQGEDIFKLANLGWFTR
jgi:hypothetical protein